MYAGETFVRAEPCKREGSRFAIKICYLPHRAVSKLASLVPTGT